MGISAGLGTDALLPGLVLVASKTFTTTSSAQQIDNCFTSQYDNYRVIYSGLGSTTSNDFVYCRMVNGTTADTVANYYVCGYNTSTGAAVATTWLAAQTQMRVGWIGNNYSEFVADFIAPQLAQRTVVNSQSTSSSDVDFLVGTYGDLVNNNTQYEGLYLYPGSGTWSGTIRVYGYRN